MDTIEKLGFTNLTGIRNIKFPPKLQQFKNQQIKSDID